MKAEKIQVGTRCVRFQSGTEIVEKVVGDKPGLRVVKCCPETVCVGREEVEVTTGIRRHRVRDGSKTVRRKVGTHTIVEEVEPASSRTERSCRTIPCQRVTVVADENMGKIDPLPGTSIVMSQSEYDAAVAGK
jgi:hypothetical protein